MHFEGYLANPGLISRLKYLLLCEGIRESVQISAWKGRGFNFYLSFLNNDELFALFFCLP